MPDAPSEAPTDYAARLEQINRDLDYYRKAVEQMGVGHQPPTIYATKYVEDMEFLMGLVLSSSTPPVQPPKSALETALEHDQAGRSERREPRKRP